MTEKITPLRLAESRQNLLLIVDLQCSANNIGAFVIFSVAINVDGMKVQGVNMVPENIHSPTMQGIIIVYDPLLP